MSTLKVNEYKSTAHEDRIMQWRTMYMFRTGDTVVKEKTQKVEHARGKDLWTSV